MRVAIYARTSRQEGDNEGSIPLQLADCREWASDTGHEVVHEYVDPGISGWKRKTRPGYEALIADAEAGRIDAVLCRDYERLLRNDKEGARWLDLYETRGFRHFLFADEADINLGRARDRKDFKERVAAAVYYSDRLSEKIRRTKAQHALDGTYSGGEREPYGYRRTRSGALEVDPEEATALHDAVARLAHGESATRVKVMKEEGLDLTRAPMLQAAVAHGVHGNDDGVSAGAERSGAFRSGADHQREAAL